jgi:hypothetical protein
MGCTHSRESDSMYGKAFTRTLGTVIVMWISRFCPSGDHHWNSSRLMLVMLKIISNDCVRFTSLMHQFRARSLIKPFCRRGDQAQSFNLSLAACTSLFGSMDVDSMPTRDTMELWKGRYGSSYESLPYQVATMRNRGSWYWVANFSN